MPVRPVPQREPILFYQPDVDGGSDPILAELRSIRLLLQAQRRAVDPDAEEDPQVRAARARQATARPTWHEEIRAGQELDVVRRLGSIALTGFLLAGEETTFVYRVRQDGEVSRPFTIPAGAIYDFGGKGVAWIRLESGRAQVALETSGGIHFAGAGAALPRYVAVYGQPMDQSRNVVLDTAGMTVLDVAADSTVPTTFHLDASPDGVGWFEDYQIWEAVQVLREGFFVGFRFVRLRADAAGMGTVTMALGVS